MKPSDLNPATQRALGLTPKKRHKYNVSAKADRTCDGMTFDSKGEAARWGELKLMERAGKITALTRQVPMEFTTSHLAACNWLDSDKMIFRLVLDFRYRVDGQWVHEDFKGMITPVARLKIKLIEAAYGIAIKISRRV